MAKIRTLLATALLTIPMLSFSGVPSVMDESGTRLETTSYDCCWFWYLGTWRCFVC
jgi:hypothetical protein